MPLVCLLTNYLALHEQQLKLRLQNQKHALLVCASQDSKQAVQRTADCDQDGVGLRTRLTPSVVHCCIIMLHHKSRNLSQLWLTTAVESSGSWGQSVTGQPPACKNPSFMQRGACMVLWQSGIAAKRG